MEDYHRDVVAAATSLPDGAIKLIRKLRWVGREEEARLLLRGTRIVFAEQGILSDIPYNTY